MKKTILCLMVMFSISAIVNSETQNVNTIFGNAEIVKCPYCGTKKELINLVSGNTFGAVYWSDNKRIAPMLPQASPVQKCPHCKKYYFRYKNILGVGKESSSERGELTYAEWKRAYNQFVAEKIGGKDKVDLYFWLIQAYNDQYCRNPKSQKPTKAECDFFVKITISFIKSFDWTQVDHPLLKAELYREAGMMQECAKVLKSIPYKSLQDYEKGIYNGIKQRMNSNDSKVFKL